MINADKINLADNEVHIWFAFPREISDKALLESYKGLMNEQERKKQQEFYFKRHQHHYLITRALVRTVLPYYIDQAPGELQFIKNRYGRPELVQSGYDKPLRFNVAHTDGLVMCGVTRQHKLGVDAEDIKRRGQTVDIADRFFSEQEVKDLLAIPEEQRKHQFFDYWTLKEAYIKACGKGLSIPLNHFSFSLIDNQPISISFDERRQENPEHWYFWLLQPSDRHKAAIGLRNSDSNHDYKVISRKTVPLQSSEVVNYPILRSS